MERPIEQTAAAKAPDAPPKRSKLAIIAPLVLIAVVGAGGRYGWDWYANGRFIVSTDDAYVRADTAIIAAKIPGYVASVNVTDNALVKAQDVLGRLDDGDYRLAVEAQRRKIDTQDAVIARIAEQIRAQGATIDQSIAQLAAARADQQKTALEFERATKLMQSTFGTPQRLEQAQAERERTIAAVQGAQAMRAAAQANLAVLEAQRVEAQRARAELVTARERAERDLSFTEIRAPFDGIVGNRAMQPGQYIQPGTRLLALVPLNSAYIEANFKETQIAHVKPGQKVSIAMDALAGRVFEGIVDSVSPASGAQFSLLPPENATGNFTKIVQRVPVRIRLPADLAAAGLFRPGLSVIAQVDTRAPDEPRPTIMGALGLNTLTH